MAPLELLTFCVLGAVGLYLMLRPGLRTIRLAGAVLFLGAAGWLIGRAVVSGGERPEPFFLTFSAIAIIAGLRMITHERPVYSALYFILVVMSSAGLFLLMLAEFMAFALVIIYAGAILITYVFVLMLAQQAEEQHDQPEYDLVPREPAAAVLVGFVMLALLSSMLLEPGSLPPAPSVQEAREQRWLQLEQLPARLQEEVLTLAPDFNWPPDTDPAGHFVRVDDRGVATVVGTTGDPPEAVTLALPSDARPENVQQVGLALVAKFPVSLELAGVILLLAMFGAVVLARKQIEIGEDEVREAAGLPRFAFHEDEDLRTGEPGGGGVP